MSFWRIKDGLIKRAHLMSKLGETTRAPVEHGDLSEPMRELVAPFAFDDGPEGKGY